MFSKGAISPIFLVEMFAISGGQTSLGSPKLHIFFDSETRVTPHLVVYRQLIISTSLSKKRVFLDIHPIFREHTVGNPVRQCERLR